MQNRQVFFNSKALFWGIGLSSLLGITNTNFWISGIIGTIIGVVILLLVRRPNNSKIIKAICGFVIALITSCILVNMGATLYLRETPIFVLAISLVVGTFIISRSKEVPLKKVLVILFAYSIFTFLIGSLILSQRAKAENLLPMFYYSFKDVIRGSILFAIVSVSPVICLNNVVEDKKNTIINYLVAMITVIFLSFLIVMVLGIKEATLYRYPEFVLLKRIKIYDFFSNVENLFIIVMVVDLLITVASGLRNIDVKGKYTKFIAPVALVILVNIIGSSSALMTSLYSVAPYVLGFLLILTLIPKK